MIMMEKIIKLQCYFVQLHVYVFCKTRHVELIGVHPIFMSVFFFN